MNAPPSVDVDAEAELLRVLGHPMRLTILNALIGGERSVSDVSERTGLGQPALSQQLAILRKASLVTTRREAKQVFYALDSERMEAIRAIVDRLSPTSRPTQAGQHNLRLGAAMFAEITPPRRL
jgi:DNA-binding transcriptional ArsR family regulator